MSDFPTPASSPWTNPDTGVTYEYLNSRWQIKAGFVPPEDFILDGGPITDISDLVLDQTSHSYTPTADDLLSATALDGGWMIILVKGSAYTLTADSSIKWSPGSSLLDINVLTGVVQLLLESDGTTVWATTRVLET